MAKPKRRNENLVNFRVDDQTKKRLEYIVKMHGYGSASEWFRDGINNSFEGDFIELTKGIARVNLKTGLMLLEKHMKDPVSGKTWIETGELKIPEIVKRERVTDEQALRSIQKVLDSRSGKWDIATQTFVNVKGIWKVKKI